MKKKTPTRRTGKPKTWLITALLASIAVAYVVFIFLPRQRKISELRAQVQERRQQIMQAQSMLRTVAQARKRLADTQQVSHKWRAEAPKAADIVTHLASFTQQADAAGVAIDRLDPLAAIEHKLIAQQGVTLQIHAPFAAVFDFLRRLEGLPGTIWVRNLHLQATSNHDSRLRGEVTLTIFVDRAD
jgi:Tfp pilus assembly protein PilO